MRVQSRQLVAAAALLVLVVDFTGRQALAEKYALVVGVNECPEFRLSDGSPPRPLRGAETDADGVARTLTQQFQFASEHVRLLKGKAATHHEIKAAFAALARQLKPADVFVLHFSGHGTQIPDRKPFDEPDGLDEALCVYDANDRGDNLLVDDELGVWLDDLPAGRVTVLLDCCHSGTGIKDPDAEIVSRFLPGPVGHPVRGQSKEPWRDLRAATKGIGRQTTAFFACHADQQAYERRLPAVQAPARAGQFSHYFLEGLQDNRADANRDGTVSNREALDYVRRRLDETFNATRPRNVDREEPVLEADAADAPLFGNNLNEE